MARCWMYNSDDGEPCGGEVAYTVAGVPICADCARNAETGLRTGALKYRGRRPNRGEVVIQRASTEDREDAPHARR